MHVHVIVMRAVNYPFEGLPLMEDVRTFTMKPLWSCLDDITLHTNVKVKFVSATNSGWSSPLITPMQFSCSANSVHIYM